jgi:hypothetical protein
MREHVCTRNATCIAKSREVEGTRYVCGPAMMRDARVSLSVKAPGSLCGVRLTDATRGLVRQMRTKKALMRSVEWDKGAPFGFRVEITKEWPGQDWNRHELKIASDQSNASVPTSKMTVRPQGVREHCNGISNPIQGEKALG